MKFFSDMTVAKAKALNPLVLAFVGDAVFTMFVRESVVQNCDSKAHLLHKKSVEQIKASGQAVLLDSIIDLFSEEEMDVFKRGRNSKQHSIAKNATPEDYGKATGLEAVIGFLYLTGQEDRILRLLKRKN